ncbi:hypothetical protein NDU88_001757 [Pleurodeles waltl]|uniref:Uncharacterized protein n=1 Tax=Pleurodeles waltl TaxID=8319 RepID=A0AAV7NF70_PLEWA|nr:hypothetical protein NDU88_001757 [Pleurodeles waltl]
MISDCTCTSNSKQAVPGDRQQLRACQHQQPQTSVVPTLLRHASSKSEAGPFSDFVQDVIGGGATRSLDSKSKLVTECMQSFRTRTSQYGLTQM